MRHIAVVIAFALLAASCGGAPPPTQQPTQPPPGTSPPPGGASPQPTLPPSAVAGISEVRSNVGRQPAGAASDAALAAMVAADAEFALRLYRAIAADESGNVFLSPYSISTALSMTHAGARGETAQQIAAALGMAIDDEAWHAARNRLELEMIARAAQFRPETGEALTLEPTNAIFGQHGFPFEDEFLRVLAAYYGAGMQALDFAVDPEAARAAINRWVAERTRDRIEELLAQGTITDLTRAVLVNAIYFKGSWVHPFDPAATEPLPFHLIDGSSVEVPMMHGQLDTTYLRGDGWQAVRLPYFGAAMLVIVPDSGRFGDVEAALTPALLAGIRQQLQPHKVDLRLPRWESETHVSLSEVLKGLGIVDAFDPDLSDLTGIAPFDDLHVSDVIHAANVTVDEEGTEAAAATAVIIDRVSAAPDPPRVALTVDRPFLYLIQDDVTGEILFIGRLLAP